MAGRRPTDPYWIDRIRQLVAENPRKPSRAIHEELLGLGYSPGGTYPPAPRTIDEIKKAFIGLTDEERLPYQKVYWPESFESGALPWEASVDTLELLHAYLHHRDRPSVRMARWFHRVSRAMPFARAAHRLDVAAALTTAEALGGNRYEVARQIEGWLAYRAWLPAAKAGYERAIEQGLVALWEGRITTPAGADPAAVARAMAEVAPGFTPEDLEAFYQANRDMAPGEVARLEGNNPLLHDLPDPIMGWLERTSDSGAVKPNPVLDLPKKAEKE